VNVVYSPQYDIHIGRHVYPTAKYRLVHDALLRSAAAEFQFVEPEPAPWADLALAHTAEYLNSLRAGTLTDDEIQRLELPWSPAILDGFRLMTGGTIVAARLARESGIAVHLGGGFHHAFADHGEGFCLFNDVAVALLVQRRAGAIRRAAVVDLDVHHGNGTAAIFGGDPSVFTFSMHQERNYPAWKPRGSLDVGLEDGCGDDEYLARLADGLRATIASGPEMIAYLAGADPYADDQLGGLSLTREGLRRRDRLVLDAAAHAGIPVVILLAGGYARRLADTVAIHVATVEEAATGGSGR
jgi:acetoin utilization deacetylase AcuC-like enzyme